MSPPPRPAACATLLEIELTYSPAPRQLVQRRLRLPGGSTVGDALKAAGYPAKADDAQMNKPMVIALLTYLVLLVTMVYGPIAALLVELFPTRIRYTSMSLPYHIGNGWFGGFLPTTAFAMVAATGDIYYGLWYPIVIAGATFVIGMLFVGETRHNDIHAD